MESTSVPLVLRPHREFKKFGKFNAKVFCFFGLFALFAALLNAAIHTNITLVVFSIQDRPVNIMSSPFIDHIPFSGGVVDGYKMIGTIVVLCILNSLVSLGMLYFNKNPFVRRSYIGSFPAVSVIVWTMRGLSGLITAVAIKLSLLLSFYYQDEIAKHWEVFGGFSYSTFFMVVIFSVAVLTAFNFLFFLWISFSFSIFVKPKYDVEMMNNYLDFQEFRNRMMASEARNAIPISSTDGKKY